MPVVADFTVLNKMNVDGTQNGTYQKPYKIGDSSGARFEHTFNTGGRHHSPGLLTLMVRRLSEGTARVAIKRKDGTEVNLGRLQESAAADVSLWRQQQFIIGTNILDPGDGEDNTLVIGRVKINPLGDNQYDDFEVRDIVVFYHQIA